MRAWLGVKSIRPEKESNQSARKYGLILKALLNYTTAFQG
jgi:hypothetical protein